MFHHPAEPEVVKEKMEIGGEPDRFGTDSPREGAQKILDPVEAGVKRAGEFLPEDQQLGDPLRDDQVAMEAPIGGSGADRPEDGAPGVMIRSAFAIPEQAGKAGAEGPDRMVGPLEKRAKVDRPVEVVPAEGALDDPPEEIGSLLDAIEKRGLSFGEEAGFVDLF